MNQENTKRIIVVLGVHRSGTSAVARGLQSLGVDLGDDLEPPVPGINEKGFYEDLETNRLNVELLTALNSDWHALSFIPAAAFDNEDLEPFKLRAIELIRTRVGHQPFGLKNPRFGRLLPFWHAVFKHLNLSPSYVIAARHPMSVAQSLKKRDGFGNEKSYYLWLEHVLQAVLGTLGTNRVFVDFDLLMSDPQLQLKRIAQALDLSFNPDSSSVKEYIGEFLDVKLRHTQFKFEDLLSNPSVPLEVINAYELLMQLARDEINIDDQTVENVFGQLNTSLKSISPALNYMTRIDIRVAECDRHVASLSQTVIERDEQLTNLKQALTSLNQTVATQVEQIIRINKNLSQSKAENIAIRQSPSFRLVYYLVYILQIPQQIWRFVKK